MTLPHEAAPIEDRESWPVELSTADASGLIATAFPRPRLSWKIATTRPDVRQTAYEIELAPTGSFDSRVISSGRIASADPFGAPWPGDALRSRQVVFARVRIWTDRGLSGWSAPLRVEGSLFVREDWVARPVSPVCNAVADAPAPVPLLRRSFAVAKDVAGARLYVSALGVHQCWFNAEPVSSDLLEPGWTSYRHRLLFSTHDVTSSIRRGENVIAAAVGDGWWRGKLTWTGRRAVYGEATALLAQLEIRYRDGTGEIIGTDGTWRGGTGALRYADIYDGCDLDLRLEPAGWQEPGFDDREWSAVDVLELPRHLEQRSAPAIRVVERREAEAEPLGSDTWAVDCGQNLAGFLRISARSEAEATIIVRHAEVLEPDGSLHTAALRGARATDSYVIPAGSHVLVPSFTYHGFRHARIAIEGPARLERIEACVVASDLREIGRFECSEPLLNALAANIRWSQRGNFIGIPTDCPQRDERMGWTGDIQVFAPTACTIFDCRAFLASWLVDLAHEQAPDGNVPSTVPNVIQGHPYEFGGVGWADAATLVPWALYEAYGDREILERQFDSMRAWVDYGLSRLDEQGVWSGDFHLGDWLDPGAPADRPEEATTNRDYIASCYLSYSARRLGDAAAVLGRADDARRYAAAAERIAAATWARWREVAFRTQTGCALAIMFDVAAEDTTRAGAVLARLVRQAGGRIATGFLGTPLVLPALTQTGQHEAAFELLLNRNAPGWLHQVLNGATTTWERWDAITADGRIHQGEMAAEDAGSMMSFNHYAYGAVGMWLYRTLAGIAPDIRQPGYRHIVFAPQPGGDIEWARAAVDTPFGRAAIAWRRQDRSLAVELTIPPGATGTFHPPVGWVRRGEGEQGPIGSGDHFIELQKAAPARG